MSNNRNLPAHLPGFLTLVLDTTCIPDDELYTCNAVHQTGMPHGALGQFSERASPRTKPRQGALIHPPNNQSRLGLLTSHPIGDTACSGWVLQCRNFLSDPGKKKSINDEVQHYEVMMRNITKQ